MENLLVSKQNTEEGRRKLEKNRDGSEVTSFNVDLLPSILYLLISFNMKHLEETVKLLTHLEENPAATQRELVEKLDVSLGKVNFIVNALVDKGLIKLERFKSSRNKKGYLYILTPKGIAEKSRITADFLHRKMEEYEKLKIEIEELKAKIESG